MFDSLKSAVKEGIGRVAVKIAPSKFGYKEDLVSFVEEEFERRETERRAYELQWRLNLAFLDGQQFVDINEGIMDIDEIPKLYWWQEREVFNQIAPIIETRVARFSKMQPKLKTRPATSESEDISSAKVCSRLLEYTRNERFTAEQRQTLFQWMESCGSVFVKNVWDTKLGKRIGQIEIGVETKEHPEEHESIENQYQFNEEDLSATGKLTADQIQKDEVTDETQIETTDEGTVVGTGIPLYEGDVNLIVVPSFEIYPDSCKNPTINECRSIIHAKAYPVDVIYEIWGVEVKPEPVESMGSTIASWGSSGLGYGFSSWNGATGQLEGYARVIEYWERPTLRYPNGRLIVVSNGQLLNVEDLPFKVGIDGEPDIPLVKIDCIKRPGCFWGRSITERLIPIQRRYNALRNRKAEYLNRCAVGQLVVEENAVDVDDVEANGAAPGYVFVKRQGYSDPHYMQNPQLPAAFNTEEAELLNMFTIISGVSEITRHSKAPPGVKSGVAMDIAVDQDDTRLSHTVENLETGLINCGKQWLRLYRQKAEQPRLLRTVGKDLEVELLEWSANDIRSDDVVIETSALNTESPAQRKQMIFDLLSMGLFNDPETGRLTKEGQIKVFDLLQFGDWEFYDDVEQLHITRAEKENKRMSEGQLPQISDIDDDTLHISRHNRFRLTGDFEELNAKTGGQAEQIFKMHTMMHLERMQQIAMQQAMSAMQMQAPEQKQQEV
jgi:hypothetical protein